jgi:tetratricopeptide (TPR) repeat protein
MPSSPKPARAMDWPALFAGLILAAGSLAAYCRTFSVPVLFDDRDEILGNPSLRHLANLRAVLSPPLNMGVGGRPLLNLSYAVNYALAGGSVFGYHVVDLLIHVVAAWTLFALVRLTLRQPVMADRFGPVATPLALAVSAIWAWHPLQTESVTYLAQRAEELMGLFYLLTLHGFARGATATSQRGRLAWFSLSVLACLAGVGSKEVIVTAPLAAVLYDRAFVAGSFREAWRRHWGILIALAATWVPLGILLSGLNQRGVGFGSTITWRIYGLAECKVVVRYLALAFWPRPLVFDYGPFVMPRVAEIWPYAVILLALLAGTAALLRRNTAAGFAAAWFFLILAPSSSIVPVVTQPMAENRVYVPLAGVVALAVVAIYAWAGRRSLPVFAAVAACLCISSFVRNQAYATETAIWTDTVAKVPQNARGHSNLASAWLRIPGHMEDVREQYAASVRLESYSAEAHNNLAFALAAEGRTQEAQREYQEVVRLKPSWAEAHHNLGKTWYATPGHMADAIAEYKEALRLDPTLAGVHNDEANAWYVTPGRMADAVAEYRAALRIDPDFAEAHNNLGNALVNQSGQLAQAVAEYETAIRLKPDYPDPHLGLALALLRQPGRGARIRSELEAALRLRPGEPVATRVLAGLSATRP